MAIMFSNEKHVWGARGSLALARIPSGEASIPSALWLPASTRPKGLVLLGHGGSSHKLAAPTSAAAERFVTAGFAAAAIDGPVHGENREDGGADPARTIGDFRSAWQRGVGRTSMPSAWSALLDELLALPALRDVAVGYAGVSMGTAYGLPFVAQEPRIAAAVFGMWGTEYPASEHLAEAAASVRCPTLFLRRSKDQTFSLTSVHDLFDAVGSADKTLETLEGPHSDLVDDALEAAFAFLGDRLPTRETT